MLYTIARAAGLLALLCPSNVAVALPSDSRAPRSLEVPWKRGGLLHRTDGGYPTDGGCTNGPDTRNCWSDGFSIDTDMDDKWPETGKTVKYDFEISNMTLAPDGVPKPMMVVNGQYPGPTIVADWGDTIQVTVKSSITTNGTGIHWHGMRQLGSNQMDGVGGVTECPIAPGETKVYTFKATQYGSSWYHSHYSVQYGDGIVGGIMINGPATANYDLDLGVLPFTDWFHMPVFTVNAAALHAAGPPIADNLLINGSMTSSAGGQYAVTTLQPGKKHLLRLVNTGINNWVHVSLDGHPFTVVSADFIPIVPYTTTSLAIAVGQRYDVIVNANQTAGNYWLRVGTGGGGAPGLQCDGPNAQANNTKSIFHYAGSGATTSSANSTGITLPVGCYDETNIVPYVKTSVPQELPEKINLGFTNTATSDNLVQWLVNGSPMMVDLTHPTLQNVIDGNATFNVRENLIEVGKENEWSYWVIQQDNTSAPIPHPIHLHGHDFYVLDQAENTQWSGDISRLKTDNPIRRDTATLPTKGYLVLAFELDNPGIWLMHCHIPFHISAGLGLQFLEDKDKIVDSIGDLSGFNEGCASWKPFQTSAWPNGFTEGDSLLKK